MTPAMNTHGKTMTAEAAHRVTWMTLMTVDIENEKLSVNVCTLQGSVLTGPVQSSRRARYAARDMLRLFSPCTDAHKRVLGYTLATLVCTLQGSNLRPHPCEGCALAN